MNTSYLYQAKDAACAAARTVGEMLRPHYGTVEHEIKNDQRNNLITELDKQAEQSLQTELHKFAPDINFRGEEFGGQKTTTTWLVDPIDGTTHFIRGLPFCTIMIALIDQDEVVLSVIYDFVRKDMYWAIRGEGAYKNDEKIHVSDRPLQKGMFTCETDFSQPGNVDQYLKLHKTARIIDTMSGGYEYALVASGKIEGRISKDPWGQDYDYAPGALLVREAGGMVANIGSKDYDYHDTSHLATNAIAYKQLTEGPDAIYPLS